MLERKIKRENQAIAGVIEALLMVALIAVVISIIQLQYIPQIMEQKEADHMDEVSNQFSYLKSVIDTQALTGSIATDAPLSHVPMTSMITLGSRELPYFITAPSFGEVRADQDENSSIEIHYFSQGIIGDKIVSYPSSFPLTSIVYDAYNSYFVDQIYVLEGGGIIVAQPDGESVMRADSSISVNSLIGNMIEMRFYLPNIIEVPGKNISSSSGNCFIRTNYSSYQTYNDIPIDFGSCLIIKSKYLNAWDESLSGLLGEEIRNNHVNVTIWPYPAQGIDVVKVSVLDSSIIDLKLTVVNIVAQVGPGWVT